MLSKLVLSSLTDHIICFNTLGSGCGILLGGWRVILTNFQLQSLHFILTFFYSFLYIQIFNNNILILFPTSPFFLSIGSADTMLPLRVPILAVLVTLSLCQYYDYDYQPNPVMGPSSPNCNQECDCPFNFPSAMYCDSRKLKFVPIVPTGIKYLYLQNNLIEEIKAGVFDNVTDTLRWLILDNNQITNAKIAKGTIDKLSGLEKLFISFNNLTEPAIPPSKSLEELRIMNNKLSKFPSGLLTDKENLTSIHLQHNDLTSEAISGAFKGLKKLLSLDVSHNKLKKLPAGVPSSLVMLYADYNVIESIGAGYLNKLPSLQYLRVSHNKLVDSGIPAGVFNVTSLLELDLSFNKLQSIPEINEQLEQLYLQANEINSEWSAF